MPRGELPRAVLEDSSHPIFQEQRDLVRELWAQCESQRHFALNGFVNYFDGFPCTFAHLMDSDADHSSRMWGFMTEEYSAWGRCRALGGEWVAVCSKSYLEWVEVFAMLDGVW